MPVFRGKNSNKTIFLAILFPLVFWVLQVTPQNPSRSFWEFSQYVICALSNCRVTGPLDLVFSFLLSAVRIVSTVGPKVLGLLSFPLSISDWPKQMARSLYIAGLLFFRANSNSGLFAFIFCYFLPFNYMILSAYT